MAEQTKIAVLGGSGLYKIDGLQNIRQLVIDTPFGSPSDAIITGQFEDCELLFLPRHGRNHSISPSNINYRANICALKQLGAQWCISVSAVGSLVEEFNPGSIVVADQIIDRTFGRATTFFDQELVVHISMANPFCCELSQILGDCTSSVAREHNFKSAAKATVVCIQGPAFSTRAESNLYRNWGAHLINMTVIPEAKLAREAELPYAMLALVTDYDCWHATDEDVSTSQILKTMEKNAENAKKILVKAVKELQKRPLPALSTSALANAFIGDPKRLSEAARQRLKPIIGKYL